jgi:hypothetical protein
MQKKNIMGFGLATVLLLGSLLLFRPFALVPEKHSCCKQAPCPCSHNNKNEAPAGMIWESLSRQFLSITPTGY